MTASDRRLFTQLRLVTSGDDKSRTESDPTERDVDWSILMARAQGGDGESYERLLQEISPYLRSLALPHCRIPQDAEDAVQDILVTIHSIRATYDPSRPFAPWLAAIARRRIVDHVRRKVRRGRHEQRVDERYEAFADPAANSEETAEFHSLETAVDSLPPGQRQAIRLLKLEELSLKEASQVSGQSISALKVATHRALKSLREALTRGKP